MIQASNDDRPVLPNQRMTLDPFKDWVEEAFGSCVSSVSNFNNLFYAIKERMDERERYADAIFDAQQARL